ncbi:MAG: hypothetical protein LBM08_10925 [Dysgonamonadaceae bacterium]|jgi:hypothetical protein|nr:hypothetical protein [Dysgonamonadaceae bacterium]
MKRNYKVFSNIVLVNMIVMLHVLTPASAGVGLYGKQQSTTSSTQTDETKQNLLSSSLSGGSIGLFDNTSQSTLTASPGGIGDGHGNHVPVADGVGILLLMAGGYLLRRKSSERFRQKRCRTHD